MSTDSLTITAGANFTLLPIKEHLAFIEEIIGIKIKVTLAPEEQILRLIYEKSDFLRNSKILAIFLKLDDLLIHGSDEENLKHIYYTRTIIESFCKIYTGTVLLLICPPTIDQQFSLLQKAEEIIFTLTDTVNLNIFSYTEINRVYPTNFIFDLYTKEQANIPYHRTYYKLLVTFLTRMSFSIFNPFKVIIVDCDNTLWNGVCGESSLTELKINAGHRALQTLLKDKIKQGFLICLCSNNNLDDVLNVFNKHPDMVLKTRDISIFQIDWKPKHDKILAISQELNLSIKSFIFIDDNPIEIEQIKIFLPDVTTFIWPQDDTKQEKFLLNLWPLDRLNITHEDIKRKNYYAQEKERRGLQKKSHSHEKFIEMLDLQININAAISFERLSQLSWRVNQFRFSDYCLTENEIYFFQNSNNSKAYEIYVKDRFGDYGIVGMLLISFDNEKFIIVEFCLSCRALGRQVELYTISFLQTLAEKMGFHEIEIHALITDRNKPAIEFIQKLQPAHFEATDNKIVCKIPVSKKCSLRNTEVETVIVLEKKIKFKKINFQTIANYNWDFNQLSSSISIASANVSTLINIWEASTNRSYDPDNSFLSQATSLELLFFASKIHDFFKCNIILSDIFEKKYISELYSLISNAVSRPLSQTAPSETSYALTARQKSIFASSETYGHDFYKIMHMWQFDNVSSIDTLENNLWCLVSSIPELRATIKNSGIVTHIINNRSLFIQKIYCSENEIAATVQSIICEPYSLYDLPTSKFYILFHPKGTASVILITHHMFFDQYSIDYVITNQFLSEKNFLVKKVTGLSGYSSYEKAEIKKQEKTNIDFFYSHYKSSNIFKFPSTQPRKATYSCKSINTNIKNSIANSLVAMNKKYEMSFFELFFSAFSATLLYYSNSTDPFIIGTAMSTRDLYLPNSLNIFGPLFNITPIKIEYTQEFSVLEWIRYISKNLRETENHKLFDPEKLSTRINSSRQLGVHSLYPVLMIWHEFTEPQLVNKNFKLNDYFFHTEKTEFDLILYVTKSSNKFKIKIEFANELFSYEQVQYFEQIFQKVISHLTLSNIDQKLNQLNVMPGLLSSRYFPQSNIATLASSITDLILLSVKDYPENLAIQSPVYKLTYLQLFTELQRCTAFLHREFSKHDIIYINIKNRIDYILFSISSLIIGLTFIPINTDFYNYLLESDSSVSSIPMLTDDEVLAESSEAIYIKLLPTTIPHTPHQLQYKIKPTDIAYRIYTSGSSGIPKAVEITYQSLVNVIEDFKGRLNLDSNVRMLNHTHPTFDIAFLEILLPLISGGCCIIPQQETQQDPHQLANYIDNMHCTLIQATPTTLQNLLSAKWQNKNKATIISGGEPLSSSLAQVLKTVSDSIWNVYGPTETTIWSMAWKVGNVNEIILGNPISNTYCFVQNALGFNCPPGSFGELYIGGKGVAKGYYKEKEKNRNSFVLDSINKSPAYKTGDVVWISPKDFNLTFIGRQDRQIKIHGKRIELPEIERALSTVSGIKQAAVVFSNKNSTPCLHGFVLTDDVNSNHDAVRKSILKFIPSYLVPDILHILQEMPINKNGKIDYVSLIKMAMKDENKDYAHLLTIEIWDWIKTWCHNNLNIHSPELHDNFFSLGGNSLKAVLFAKNLSMHTKKQVSPIDIFRYSNFNDLIKNLFCIDTNNTAQIINNLNESKDISDIGNNKVAIIGISLKLPGINEIEDFWEFLRKHECTIKNYSEEKLMALGVPRKHFLSHNYMPVFSHIEDSFQFDADFFSISPKEAAYSDPQYRILLELTWKAIEDAGIILSEDYNDIGIYTSCQTNHYLNVIKTELPHILSRERLSLELTSDPDFFATKIAHKLNLCGKAISINTACSSGLVGIVEACKAIQANECDVMVTAAASITLNSQVGYFYEQGHIFSKNGHCYPFTEDADGTVPGSGAAVFVLKRLSKAIEDKNPIYAVIEGVSTNNDGSRKASYTAPSLDGHAECIRTALAASKIGPEKIAFIEAHGTGTYIGDPIEIEAFKNAYGSFESTCFVGAVKANVGHTNTAAGLIGLAKLCLARKHGYLPGAPIKMHNLKSVFKTNSSFKLLLNSMPWPDEKPYAGISSLGIGGTNSHLIIGPPPIIKQESTDARPFFILPLSAQSIHSLNDLRNKVLAFIRNNDFAHQPEKLDSFCQTMLFGRKHFKYRFICLFKNLGYLINKLNQNGSIFIEDSANNLIQEAKDWHNGKTINWKSLYVLSGNFINAPTYSFDHTKAYDIYSNSMHTSMPHPISEYDDTSTVGLVKEIFEEILGYDNLPTNQDFFTLGGDSLSGLDLIAHIEKRFAISISLDEIQIHKSIEQLAQFIQHTQGKLPAFQLLSLNQSPKNPLLILIHPGNGNVYHYRPLAAMLSREFQIYTISYPIGREEFNSITEMAQAYIELIKGFLDSNQEYFLGGWSYGATVAQEMTFQLSRTNKKLPKRLILIDGWSTYSSNLLQKEHFLEAFFEASDLYYKNNNLWIDSFWENISNRMKILIDHIPHIISQDVILIKAKNYPKYLVKINYKNNGWKKYVRKKIETFIVDGDHNKMMESPYLNQVAAVFLNQAKLIK